MKIRLSPDLSDVSIDELLKSYLSEVQEKIKGYCKRKSLPDALFYTVVSMTVELYGFRNTDNRTVVLESQGSRSMTYAGINDVDSIISGYAAELNRYRRLKVT